MQAQREADAFEGHARMRHARWLQA
jgi:hypothetical protein